MAESNFKVFNEAGVGMSDAEYVNDQQRQLGVAPGIAKPSMHNKLYRQVSIMAAAIAQAMVLHNVDAKDNNFQALVNNLQKAFAMSVNGVAPVGGNVTLPVFSNINGLVPATANPAGKVLRDDGTWSDISGLEGILPISKGGTGAQFASNALINLGIDIAFTAASISGDNLILKRKNRGSETLAIPNHGIINQRLGQNGFIEFANGLMVQWGYSLGYKAVSFPIPFSSANWIIATTLYTSGRTEGNYDDILTGSKTSTGFKWTDNELKSAKEWIAIGV